MTKIWITKTYDIRPLDFVTGKRLPIDTASMKTCDCCGRRIVKINELNTGKIIGSECAQLVNLYPQYTAKFLRMSAKQVNFFNQYL